MAKRKKQDPTQAPLNPLPDEGIRLTQGPSSALSDEGIIRAALRPATEAGAAISTAIQSMAPGADMMGPPSPAEAMGPPSAARARRGDALEPGLEMVGPPSPAESMGPPHAGSVPRPATPSETSPAVPTPEQPDPGPPASITDIMASRSREQLTARGLDVSMLEEVARTSRAALPEMKRRLDDDVRRIFELRQGGQRQEADALARRVREQRAAMEQGLKDTVKIERLLKGDESFLTEDEQARRLEGRRQDRIDMLETNLPLLRQTFTPAVDAGREADRQVLESYGLTDLEAQDSDLVDRRTRGVGLPRSQGEFAQQQLDRLNQFDIEGFVNRAPVSTVFGGRDDAISSLTQRQRQDAPTSPGVVKRAIENAPPLTDAFADRNGNIGEVPEVVQMVAADALYEAAIGLADGGESADQAANQLNGLVAAIVTMRGSDAQRRAVAAEAIKQLRRVDLGTPDAVFGPAPNPSTMVSGLGTALGFLGGVTGSETLSNMATTSRGVSAGLEGFETATDKRKVPIENAIRKLSDLLE
jgi:hypothetical protein